MIIIIYPILKSTCILAFQDFRIMIKKLLAQILAKIQNFPPYRISSTPDLLMP